jgi:CheY-like chemotaxis protein
MHEGDTTTRRPEDVSILVADDEPDVAAYLSSVLEDAGMNVLVAHDGEEALRLIREQTPDLISLDLVMPRKSGIKVLMELRRNREWSRIPVMIVTAHARDPEVRGDLNEALADSTMVGPSLYLEKPVTARSYLESVCKIVGVAVPEDLEDGIAHTDSREEAMHLLASADEATVNAVLNKLKGG